MKKNYVLGLALSALMFLTSCGGGEKTPEKEADTGGQETQVEETATNDNGEKIFQLSRFSQGTADKTQYVWQDGDGLAPYLLFRSLLMAGPEYKETKPDLAELKISDDNLVYEFTMKDGLKWSDGEPITVEDVNFSIKSALRTSLINGIFPQAFLNIEGAEEYQSEESEEISGISISDNKITIKLKEPVGLFEQIMAQFYILPKHALENENILELNNSDFWNSPVTSGMYKVDNINPGNFIELVQNENYENEKPNFDKVVINFLQDPVIAMKDNKSYFYSTNRPEELNQLNEVESLSQFPIDILFYRYFIANLSGINGEGNSLISDPKVRAAILHAINREELVGSLFKDIGIVNYTGVPTTRDEFLDDVEKYEYNPEKAKQLLKEANYDSSRKLKIAYYYQDQASVDFMQAISYQLNEVGIPNEVTQIQTDATNALFNLREYDIGYKGLASFGYEGWYGEYSSDNTNFKNILNDDDSFDELYNKLSRTSDNEERKSILEDLQRLEQEKLFKLNLFTINNFLYINTDKVKLPEGIDFGNPFYKFDYQFEKWDAK